MPIELHSRVCGPVHVVSAKGRLVAGPECGQLEAILNLDSRRHLKQVVLEVSGLNRLDSLGLGLIVRTAASLRRRNGDLRLANPASIVTQLLELTRVAAILNSYPTDEAAILSFMENEPAPAASTCTGCCVMIVDQSLDFAAFVATLLAQHSCDVKLASLISDAKILLRFQPVDTILIGSGPMPATNMALALQSVAPKAKILTLDTALHTRDAHEAANQILRLLRSHNIIPAQA
ncbi:MAG: STAS domain-containing protein [Acidobacteriaceae bacterium]